MKKYGFINGMNPLSALQESLAHLRPKMDEINSSLVRRPSLMRLSDRTESVGSMGQGGSITTVCKSGYKASNPILSIIRGHPPCVFMTRNRSFISHNINALWISFRRYTYNYLINLMIL
jgi:hypothetical protein